MRTYSIVLCGGLASVMACGGEGGGSTPVAPTPAVQSIAVTSSSDQLFSRASETFTATASMSTGGSQAVSGGVWGSDAPSAASVEAASGRVTGAGSGMATVMRAEAEQFVAVVSGAAQREAKSVGLGTDVRFSRSGAAGAALVVEGRVLHLSAFSAAALA